MLKEAYDLLSEHSHLVVKLIAYSIIAQVSVSALASWLLWRLWAFTVQPRLHPEEPKELPYWIPRHAKAFIADAQALIDYGKAYFDNTGEPFTITVGGRKLYILTSAEDVASVYKNNVTLSWDAMLNDLLIGFGVRAHVIQRLWEKLPIDILQKARADIKPGKVPHVSVVHSTLDLYKRQLLPGPRFEKINDILTGYIDRSLRWSEILSIYQHQDCTRVSLSDLCSRVLVDAITRTLFGDGIYRIEPEMNQHLLDFNEDAWKLVFQYPQSADSKMNKARKCMLKAFVTYMQGPESLRAGQSWLLTAVMEEQQAVDIIDEDRAALMLMIYWAANINPYRLAFWMLSYILFDPNLHATLKAETALASSGKHPNIPYLMTKCPRLDATYQETLRIVNGALSARKIVAPTVIGGKTLHSPNTILIPFRQLQYDKRVFGDDPSRFEPERFLHDKGLSASPNFRPFGGGVNYCPGRFLARQEMFVFVALMLHRFQISLSREPRQRFPELDTSTPALGINGTKSGMDVLVDIREAS